MLHVSGTSRTIPFRFTSSGVEGEVRVDLLERLVRFALFLLAFTKVYSVLLTFSWFTRVY